VEKNKQERFRKMDLAPFLKPPRRFMRALRPYSLARVYFPEGLPFRFACSMARVVSSSLMSVTSVVLPTSSWTSDVLQVRVSVAGRVSHRTFHVPLLLHPPGP